LLADASNAYYSLHFDETTNSADFKELQVSIQYWSEHEEKIVFKHLETFFIGKATGDILADNLLNVLKNADLTLTKLLMLARDGPNVNKKVQSIINVVVQKKRGTSLLDIGSCNLHIVHNAFRKGLETFLADVGDMVITVNAFLDGWPSRQKAFLDTQIKVNVPQHCFS